MLGWMKEHWILTGLLALTAYDAAKVAITGKGFTQTTVSETVGPGQVDSMTIGHGANFNLLPVGGAIQSLTSSDPSVVVVKSVPGGMTSALKAGNAMLTVGFGNGLTASVAVTVT